MLRNVFRIVNVVLMVLFLSACANVVTPTGGPKDTKAPEVVKSIPANHSVNFNSSKALLFFDEYIQLKDVSNQVIISPSMEKQPEITVNGKTVQILFKDSLKPNTTYNINFSNAIVDITEGNVAENFQYVFSTGSSIDSLKVEGVVINSETGLPEKGVLVMLYDNPSDSAVFKARPLYLGRTKENGHYSITNIKEGAYKAIALKDNNADLKYDPGTELIGFKDSLVEPQNKDSINFKLFIELRPQKLLKAFADQPGKVVFIFARPYEPMEITPLISMKKDWEIREFSRKKDTLNFWFSDLSIDSLHFLISYNGTVKDTVHLATKKINPEKPSEKNILNLRLTSGTQSEIIPLRNFTITASQPLEKHDLKMITISEDSILKMNFPINLDENGYRKISISYPWRDSSKYQVNVPKGVLTNIFHNQNDTTIFKFKVTEAEKLGNLLLKVNVPKPANYVVQLTDEKDNVIREDQIMRSQGIKYEFITAQKYKVRLIDDRNNNGRWDTGNYTEKVQPETIYHFPDLINVRPNWDMEMQWNIK